MEDLHHVLAISGNGVTTVDSGKPLLKVCLILLPFVMDFIAFFKVLN
jgi:hypothetical protein